MNSIPQGLAAMAAWDQWILWANIDGRKLPIDHRTGRTASAHDHDIWMDAETALKAGGAEGYGVGFVFTATDPFFFLDIDHCLDGGAWSPTAREVMAKLPGAAVEVSQSGEGLHIFGTGYCPPHACKNINLGLELYTEARFVAMTGDRVVGDSATDCSAYLPGVVADYFPHREASGATDWTDEPRPEWSGPEDDDALLEKALKATSAASVFGSSASFRDLWEAREESLAEAYPAQGDSAWDGSSADAALAQHLAFWTGCNPERMQRIMLSSALVRDKWDREDYLPRTILRACSLQGDVYSTPAEADNSIADAHGAPKLRASSEAQRAYAENMRAVILEDSTEEQRAALCTQSGPAVNAKFWIDNQERTPAELVDMTRPVETVAGAVRETTRASGLQYLTADLQLEHFAGCVYVQNSHKVFTPSGMMLKPDQFNATYGGYIFQLDETGDKTTKKAWEAFTESQIIRRPIASATCFRPEIPSGTLVEEEGLVLVNCYVEIPTDRAPGDVGPFMRHLAKVLPNESDREILLAYMAAIVQHKGEKFQWAPLLQGCEGNGKTFFSRCVAFAVGQRYTHTPPASEMAEKFNDWLFNKIFIGIEDVFVPDNKREVMEILKPMITNDRLAMRAMQQGQVMGDNRANFMLNSNHKDAIRKSADDRRFAVFYTAQQSYSDLERDGMVGNYFPDLYEWARTGGYAAVNHLLSAYEIPAELNPAAACKRAPRTTSQDEAVMASLGRVEQTILEAIEEGQPGFCGGFVSSVALGKLLSSIRADRQVPVRKRRELMQTIGYDYHPALKGGRTTQNSVLDDGKKPRIYVHKEFVEALAVKRPAEVFGMYLHAQTEQIEAEGAAIFGE